MNNAKIRVLHIVNNFGIGGLESVIKQMVLSANNVVSPYVFVLTKVGRFATIVANEGVPLYHLNRLNNKTGLKASVDELCYTITQWKIDILHCHDMSSWFFGVFASLKTGKPIVLTRHGNLEKWQIKYVILTKLFSMFTHKIIAVSPETKLDLIKHQAVNKQKIEIIYNGINTTPYKRNISRDEARKRLKLPRESFVTGTVTRFHPVKNINLQIDMVEHLKGHIPTLKHIIVAPITTNNGEKFKKIIERRGLKRHILLLGFRDDIPNILKAMDAFVLTSFSEGTSIALIEAIAAGIPIVTSNVGGNPNLVKDGYNGFLFDLNKEKDFEGKILRIHENNELGKLFSKNQKTVISRFSEEIMINKYNLVYKSMMN